MWIDLTVTVRSGMVHWPSDPGVEVRRVKDIGKGDSSTVSLISMGCHSGTHMDAPLHFFPGGKGLDQLPLEAVIGQARVIAIRDKKSIKPEELRRHAIRKGERLLFKTVNSGYWRSGGFRKDFVSISPEAAQFLVKKGVRTVGIDYLSVGAYGAGAPTHKTLLKAGIWIIEGLDLFRVSPGSYDLICLPIKIAHSDGAPCRALLSPASQKKH
ncbi:MAG: cyclase family protein [Deltaproteobacteria bacterium]